MRYRKRPDAYVSLVSAAIIVQGNRNSSAYQSFANWPIV